MNRSVLLTWAKVASLVGVLALQGGCSGVGAAGEDEANANATVESTSAISQASDSAQALELSGLLALVRAADAPPLGGGRGPHGQECDVTPEVTFVEVCGKQLPEQARFQWDSCARPSREGRGHHEPGKPSGPAIEKTGTGDISITTSTSGPADCVETTPFEVTEDATFVTTRGGRDGGTESVSGSSHTVSQRILAERRPLSRTSTFATTRERKDEAGVVVSSLRLEGQITVAFDDGTSTPQRTSAGSFTYDHVKDAATSTGTITLLDVVSAGPRECRWPLAGRVIRDASDGTSQTLEFTSTCGEATLDGLAITLTDDRPKHGREGGGEGGPKGGEQPPPGPM